LVIKEIKELYKEGADTVELEMITQDEFDKIIKPYTP